MSPRLVVRPTMRWNRIRCGQTRRWVVRRRGLGEGSAAPLGEDRGRPSRAEANYPLSTTTTTTITAPIASTTRRRRRRVVRPTLRWNLTSGVRCGVVLIIIILRLRSHGERLRLRLPKSDHAWHPALRWKRRDERRAARQPTLRWNRRDERRAVRQTHPAVESRRFGKHQTGQ